MLSRYYAITQALKWALRSHNTSCPEVERRSFNLPGRISYRGVHVPIFSRRKTNYLADADGLYWPSAADVRDICTLYAVDYVAFGLPIPSVCRDLFVPRDQPRPTEARPDVRA